MRDADAARRIHFLTNENLSQGDNDRFLAIVLDAVLLSAPAIRGAIADHGQITGEFTQEEVDFIVAVLRAGQMPVALKPVTRLEWLSNP